MSVPSRIQVLRVDSLSVVPYPQSKNADAVSDLRFDLICVCVPESISQRLARNAINVIAKDWMQVPRRTLYRNPKRRRTSPAIAGPSEFFTQRGQSFGEFVRRGVEERKF